MNQQARKILGLTSSLLAWYPQVARDLPWRRTRDPYGIWVSEIMLQQTQVRTVIPYWERWMSAFPTVQDLARARLDRVLKLWEGLGYYSRARNLHRAAQTIAELPGARVPDTLPELLELPGIGRYTAGAIASIAFNQPAPILDGNVIRVLTRVHALRDDPRERATNHRLWELATELVEAASTLASHAVPEPCSSLNQALMELGASLCSPLRPNCSACPIQSHCQASKLGLTDSIPNLARRPETIRRRFVAVVRQRGDSVWIQQRPEGVVNQGLWEFPNLEVPVDEESLAAHLRNCAGQFATEPEKLFTIRHTITKYRILLEVFRVNVKGVKGKSAPDAAGRWCPLQELEHFAFPSAHRKIVRHLLDE